MSRASRAALTLAAWRCGLLRLLVVIGQPLLVVGQSCTPKCAFGHGRWVDNTNRTDAVARMVAELSGGPPRWHAVAERYAWRPAEARCALRPFKPVEACALLRDLGMRRVLIIGDSTQREFFWSLSYFFRASAGRIADDNATTAARARMKDPRLQESAGNFHRDTSFVLRAMHQRTGGYTEDANPRARRRLKGDSEMLSAAFGETCYAATPTEAAPTHDLSVAFVRDELFVGTALMRAGAQCATWERTGWLAPGACAAAAARSRDRSWTWISQRPDEVAFDWRRDMLPRADLVVAQSGPHVASHKLLDRRLRTDFVPLLAAALRNRTSPPLFLLRTSHLPVEMCARQHTAISQLFAEQLDSQSSGAAKKYNWPEILKCNQVFARTLGVVDSTERAAARPCDAVAGLVDVAKMTTTRPDYFEGRECMHMLYNDRDGVKAHGWSLQFLWNTIMDLRPRRQPRTDWSERNINGRPSGRRADQSDPPEFQS